jgi:hypothetical protein
MEIKGLLKLYHEYFRLDFAYCDHVDLKDTRPE